MLLPAGLEFVGVVFFNEAGDCRRLGVFGIPSMVERAITLTLNPWDCLLADYTTIKNQFALGVCAHLKLGGVHLEACHVVERSGHYLIAYH